MSKPISGFDPLTVVVRNQNSTVITGAFASTTGIIKTDFASAQNIRPERRGHVSPARGCVAYADGIVGSCRARPSQQASRLAMMLLAGARLAYS